MQPIEGYFLFILFIYFILFHFIFIYLFILFIYLFIYFFFGGEGQENKTIVTAENFRHSNP